jgi:hypothetical protein
MMGTLRRFPTSKNLAHEGGRTAMPLPEKEYFCLDEVEERWGIQRRDTIYYAENGLLEIAMRVAGITIETGLIEPEPDGGCYKVPEDYRRYSGLLTLCSCDLALLLRRGSATIHGFDPGDQRYSDIVAPRAGIEVRACDLVVTRAERDRFEQAYGIVDHLTSNGSRAIPAPPPVDCSDDGSWIRVGDQEYQFSGLLQKMAIRRLYEAWESDTPRLNMQSLLEDIDSRSRHISQIFGNGNPHWREIVAYRKGYVWLKTEALSQSAA